MRFLTTSIPKHIAAIIIASLLLLGVRPLIFQAGAAQLQNRAIKPNISYANATVRYQFTFDIQTAGPLGSITFDFCDNSPLEVDPCNAPAGFDASGANLVAQTGQTGFSILSATPNQIVLTRVPAAAGVGTATYTFTNVDNPSAEGTYFARITTYATDDATGSATDFGGLAFAINLRINISTTVPPYLLFCVGVTISGFDCGSTSGAYVNFGELSSTNAKTATTQMLTATNAGSGYSIILNGTTMLSGTNSIPALAVNDVSRPGTSQFGINLRNNSDPNIGANTVGSGSGSPTANYNIVNRYRFVSGEQIVSNGTSDEYRKYTVSYIVNIAKGQAPGVYVSTITYICTASF